MTLEAGDGRSEERSRLKPDRWGSVLPGDLSWKWPGRSGQSGVEETEAQITDASAQVRGQPVKQPPLPPGTQPVPEAVRHRDPAFTPLTRPPLP